MILNNTEIIKLKQSLAQFNDTLDADVDSLNSHWRSLTTH